MGRGCFLFLALAAVLALAGCGSVEQQAQEKLSGALEWAGGKIVGALDELENAEYEGGPFENNMESARTYLLGQLAEERAKREAEEKAESGAG